MKRMIVIVLCLALAACGYSSLDNELTGQVKRVKRQTPLICSDYTLADISLGVMRNGVGSVSTQDILLVVPDQKQKSDLESAADSGKLVKVKYDERRVSFCQPEDIITEVSILQ